MPEGWRAMVQDSAQGVERTLGPLPASLWSLCLTWAQGPARALQSLC